MHKAFTFFTQRLLIPLLLLTLLYCLYRWWDQFGPIALVLVVLWNLLVSSGLGKVYGATAFMMGKHEQQPETTVEAVPPSN